MLEEAEKRDHRKLGREMELFHFQEEAPGMVFWHPNGWTIYRALEDYMRRRLDAPATRGQDPPGRRPQAVGGLRPLGQVPREHVHHRDRRGTCQREAHLNALKPMNCPCHVQIFNQGLKSYRDLPLRLAEFGSCHRYEAHGALHGLMRVRGFTQDDAHIFCTEDQIESECAAFIELLSGIYRDAGFASFDIKFSTRPEVRAGLRRDLGQGGSALEKAILSVRNDYEIDPGEGAFYGPKLDFKLTDAIGREWQCGTFQADFVLPERLDANYIGPDGEKHRPVMLHRAILGSFERFIGILIENYAGKLPFWLAPRQVVVASIVSEADAFVRGGRRALTAAGLRAEADIRNEKINYKVREHSVGKVPVILAVGRKEVEDGTVTVRRLGEKQTQVMALDALVAELAAEAVPPDLR
jgi:threonyl-tRNA synthetase